MNQKLLLLCLLIYTGLTGYTQNEKNMNQKQFKIPMQKGKNKTIQYKTLEIEPVNLFVQDRPFNDRSVHIQLELNCKEGDKKFHTFLWYYEKGKTNYPQASGKYLYSLEIGKNDAVAFIVEEVGCDKPFFVNFRQEAKIGDLTIKYSESIDVMGARSDNGTGNESYAVYELLLSDKNEEKSISIDSSELNTKKTKQSNGKTIPLRLFLPILSFYN